MGALRLDSGQIDLLMSRPKNAFNTADALNTIQLL